MREEQAEEIIDLIVSFYPTYVSKKNEFDKPEVRINYLMNRLLERDYKATLVRVEEHLHSSPYEPKLSDILPPIKPKRLSVDEQLKLGGVD